MEAIGSALLAFGVSLVALDIVERWWHLRKHDTKRYYRWGVWAFSILVGVYTYVMNLGR